MASDALDAGEQVGFTVAMADVQVRLLGQVAAVVDGSAVDLSSRKQRALLALLALHAGNMLTVDRLVDDLWGETPPPTARHALQVHVSNLRKLLGSEVVVTDRPGYRLEIPTDSCDATRFEALATEGKRALRDGDPKRAASTLTDALALWRGPALADLQFEPFAPHEAARLEELRVAAAEDRIVADLELGGDADLVGELEALVAQHPLRERLQGLLMLALYRSGRQVEALSSYRRFRDHLRDELGLDPGPDLQQLEAAVLRHDPTLRAPTIAEGQLVRDATETPGPAMESNAESRRVATVLVASLGGFDRAARELDPEDLHTLLDRCSAKLSAVVGRYGGTIENVVGGEIVAVFGAPVAHEDDPERALRAAFELQREVREHPADFGSLEVRTGVSTGDVLFAASGPPGHRRLTVIGDVVNHARRLQAQSDGYVAVSAATRTATEHIATYDRVDDGSFVLRDVTHEKQARPLGLTRFIGRDAELELMLDAWQRTINEGRPNLISVLGEPGVGKSRLLAEFRERAAGGGIVMGRCVPYGAAQTYSPLSEALQQAAGVSNDDPPSTARSKLGHLVRSVYRVGEDVTDVERHLALLTGLDDEHDRPGDLVDERTLHGSTRRFLEALARSQPLCIVIEDVHWADDALLDLIHGVARRVKGVSLSFITFARPELIERRSDWGGGVPALTSISLEPLDEASTKELVAELGSAHAIPDEVLAEIAARSSGNPLFAEELVATVAEGDASRAIPASLTSLLLARIDALPPEQQHALRCASVVGVTFWLGAVAALQEAVSIQVEAPKVGEAIADLESRDLLRMEPGSAVSDDIAYSFKHVLIREAAYASLPRSQRATFHAAAADWLSAVAGDRVAEFSEQLADHASSAGQPDRALQYLTTAADRARRAASHRREAALLAKALAIARSLDRPLLVADLHQRRGNALARLARWADAREEFEHALDGLPSDTPDDRRRIAELHTRLCAACFWLFDTAALRNHAEAARDLAEQIGAHDLALAARAHLTNADSAEGMVDVVLDEGRRVVADAKAWGVQPPYQYFNAYALNLSLTGDWATATDISERAVLAGRERGDTQIVLWAMSQVGMAATGAGRYDEAIAIFDEARRFGEEYELVAGLPRCIAISGGLNLDLFDFAGAEAIHDEARELGGKYFNPTAVSAGIDLLFNFTRRGEVERAEPLVDGLGEEVVKGAGWHGWLWRLRFAALQAEMALARGDDAAAIELARDAIAQSRSKRRGKYEAFGLVTAGRALAAMGRKREALTELSSAVAVTQRLASPAIHVLAVAAALEVEPDEVLAASGREAIDRILSTLPEGATRQRFESAAATEVIRSATS